MSYTNEKLKGGEIMQLQELMIGKLQTFPTAKNEIDFKSDKSGKEGSTFNDVLKTTVGNGRDVRNSQGYSSRTSRNADVRENASVSAEPKAYKQIVLEKQMQSSGAKTQSSENKPVEETKTEKPKDAKQPSESQDQNSAVFFNVLAQNLGLNPEELQTVLDAAGVTPEELSEASGTKEISDKIASVLGLDEGQSKILVQLLNNLKANTVSNVQGVSNVKAEKKEFQADIAKVQLVSSAEASEESTETLVNTDKVPNINEFSALVLKAKLKLNSIKEGLSSENSSSEAESTVAEALTSIVPEIKAAASNENADAAKTGSKALEDAANITLKADKPGNTKEEQNVTASKADNTVPVSAKAEKADEVRGRFLSGGRVLCRQRRHRKLLAKFLLFGPVLASHYLVASDELQRHLDGHGLLSR
jgi:hypothetical protein